MSGQYASYWNAFLFQKRLSVHGGGGGLPSVGRPLSVGRPPSVGRPLL